MQFMDYLRITYHESGKPTLKTWNRNVIAIDDLNFWGVQGWVRKWPSPRLCLERGLWTWSRITIHPPRLSLTSPYRRLRMKQWSLGPKILWWSRPTRILCGYHYWEIVWFYGNCTGENIEVECTLCCSIYALLTYWWLWLKCLCRYEILVCAASIYAR